MQPARCASDTRRRAVLLACLTLIALATTLAQTSATPAPTAGAPTTPAPATAAPKATRGVAEVGVVCDLTNRGPWDKVGLSIKDNTDEKLLRTIAADLATRFNVPPKLLDIRDPAAAGGDTHPYNMIEDKRVGVYVGLPAVPRDGSGKLPFGPFVEAFAPYASELHVVYVIQGPFTFTGMAHYDNPDVTYTVDPPETRRPASEQPTLAFYGVNVMIKHTVIAAGSLPDLQPTGQTATGHPRLWLLLLGALVAAASIALLVAYIVLPRLKAWATGGVPPPGGGK
jgi:hypothetical protein